MTLIKLLNLSVDIYKAIEMGEMSSYILTVNYDNMDEMFRTALIHIVDVYNFLFFSAC